MPILDIRFVAPATTPAAPPSARQLADALGPVFGAAPGRTWVRLHRHDAADYAENDAPLSDAELPVFATLLLATLPEPGPRVLQARAVCEVVARLFGRPVERVHLEYAPEGRGRVAFGGELMR